MPTQDATEYRSYALSIRLLADHTDPGPERDTLLKLAIQWDRLAVYKRQQDEQRRQ
jgi:hypothetical protein